MQRFAALTLLSAIALAVPATAAVTNLPPPADRTVFHYAERAWGVGTIRISKALTFREGRLLAFPGVFEDLLWAPNNTKPRNMMIVYEVATSEKDSPFFKEGDEFFAPIRLLSDHSFWKDNLPTTPRHEVFGGRRSVFRGDAIPEARRIIGAYLEAGKINSLERWKAAIAAVSSALVTPVPVLREDAVRYLTGYATLSRDFDERSLPPVEKYLNGDAPGEEKIMLIDALAAGGVSSVKPVLQKLASHQDAVGAGALRGLAKLGETPDEASLIAHSRSSSPEIRAWAAEALGPGAKQSDAAFARLSELLTSDAEAIPVRDAAAQALAASGNPKAQAVLLAAIERGDDGSQPAGEAVAAGGMTGAVPSLIQILDAKQGDAALAAVLALGHMKGCADCGPALQSRYKTHKDEQVRNLIGIVQSAPLVHKH